MKTEELRLILIEKQMRDWSTYSTNLTWKINPDFSVDVTGYLHIIDILDKLPFKIRKSVGGITFTFDGVLSMKNFDNFPDEVVLPFLQEYEPGEYFSYFPHHPSYNKPKT